MQARILVPLDGSCLAEQALPYALTLGRGLPAELVLFRAISIPPEVQEALDRAGLKADPLMEHLKTDAKEYLEAISQLASSTDLKFSQVIRHGLAADAIVDYVEQMGIQLIVMASHGYTGLKRWTHGSVAERVLQQASAPVLLVRAEETTLKDLRKASACRSILVPLDGSKMAEQILPVIAPIASALACEMNLLQVPIISASGAFTGGSYPPLASTLDTVDQDAKAYLDRLANDLSEQGIKVSTATWMGPVAQTIVDYAKVNDIDLIAMCTHGRTGLARWALGSVADRVLRAGEKPILLVRAQDN